MILINRINRHHSTMRVIFCALILATTVDREHIFCSGGCASESVDLLHNTAEAKHAVFDNISFACVEGAPVCGYDYSANGASDNLESECMAGGGQFVQTTAQYTCQDIIANSTVKEIGTFWKDLPDCIGATCDPVMAHDQVFKEVENQARITEQYSVIVCKATGSYKVNGVLITSEGSDNGTSTNGDGDIEGSGNGTSTNGDGDGDIEGGDNGTSTDGDGDGGDGENDDLFETDGIDNGDDGLSTVSKWMIALGCGVGFIVLFAILSRMLRS
jgi:hypothetical protein